MKILAIHRHYDCDTATDAAALRAIVEHQAAAGRSITVYTSQLADHDARRSSGPNSHNACVSMRRIRILRERNGSRLVCAFNITWFLLRALIHAVIANQYDLVIAHNRPSVLMGCVLRVIRALRGTPYIYICYDLYPESAVADGSLRRGWLHERSQQWETAACSAARRTVVPSHDMAETLAAHGVPADRISVIKTVPCVAKHTAPPTLPPLLTAATDTTRFLFVGELARRQGLERLIAAARLVAGRVPFQFVFMGDGPAKPELVELAGDLLGRRIVFVSPPSAATAVEALRACDYGIVSFAADAHRFTYPLESAYYVAAGCPVIAVIEPHSELAQTMARHDWGHVVASRSVTDIAETIVTAVFERRNWTPQRRLELERSGRAVFGQTAIQDAWDEVIADDFREPVAMPRRERTSKAA